MYKKRVTIYDLAKALDISPSYVSKALNNHASVNAKTIAAVKQKATELNYKYNSHAANLRQGSSKTIGVIVPHINQSFFSDAIAGIEEVCFAHNHSLIICQSHESLQQECLAIETLIHQNVDCILISVSQETQTGAHLSTITENNIKLIQFDRCIEQLDSYKVLNDNREAATKVVKDLYAQGYRKIAFLGGPEHLVTFKHRKQGYLKGIKETNLNIPRHFIVDDALAQEKVISTVKALLQAPKPPDALLTVSDHQSLWALQTAAALHIKVPAQLGIFGFANEAFAGLIHPSLSSVDQKSKDMGKRAAGLYFEKILNSGNHAAVAKKAVIKSEIITRQSSSKRSNGTSAPKLKPGKK